MPIFNSTEHLPHHLKLALITGLLLITTVVGQTQNILEKVFLPKQRLYEIPYLDPNEAMAYGAFAFWWDDGKRQQKAYVPISFGFYKPVMQWNKKRRVEFGIDAAAHFQFEWLISDSIVQRNLLNADYKFSFLLAFQMTERDFIRLRGYHVSSHFGDDYMVRNNMSHYVRNPNNYEQLDIQWARQDKIFRHHVGFGVVIRPETIRKRYSAQFGSYFDVPFRGAKPRGCIGGAHVRLLQENNFRPGLKLGVGIRLGKRSNLPFRFIAEFCRGNVPFSAMEYRKIQLLGVGLYFLA
jgi:Protein of unknown function (DUF1207)